MKRRSLGSYIVADPEVCHGKPTFKGTRIMVWQVLEQVANGKSWDDIVAAWSHKFPREAVAEALRLASESFAKQTKRSVPA